MNKTRGFNETQCESVSDSHSRLLCQVQFAISMFAGAMTDGDVHVQLEQPDEMLRVYRLSSLERMQTLSRSSPLQVCFHIVLSMVLSVVFQRYFN